MTRVRTIVAFTLMAWAAGLLVGCSMHEVSVEVGATHLRSVAIANYERAGGGRLERLLELLSSDPMLAAPVMEVEVPAGPAAPPEPTDAEPSENADPLPMGPPRGIGLDLALMTEVQAPDGRLVLAAVADGDPLLDGFGRPGDGDGIKLRLQTDAECIVYVIQVDASARPRTLFPNTLWSTVGNPVLAGRPYRLPEGNVLFGLGDTRGIETLYVVASPEPWPELEALLAETESATWDRLETPAIVERASHIRRGVKTVYANTAHAVGGPSGTLTDVPSTLYVGRPGARLVVTRWFRHH